MRILGVDPGLNVTGYGLLEISRTARKVKEAGYIKTSARNALPERLDKLFGSLTALIAESVPDVLVLEKLYAHYRHPLTSCLLGHARGVICLACARNKIPLVEYPATRIKKAVVGKGQATKNQMKRMVEGFLGVGSLNCPCDVTDAIALAIAHYNIVQSGARMNEQRLKGA